MNTSSLERSDIRRDVLRLLENSPPETLRARDIAQKLGYESPDAYGRFRDVLDVMEEEELVRREGLRYVARPDAAAKKTALKPQAAEVPADASVGRTAAPEEHDPSARAEEHAGTAQVTTLPSPPRTYEQPGDKNKAIGRLIVKPQGFGFVEVEDQEEDFFIREHNMGTALNGDIVLVGLAAPKRSYRESGKRRECEVLKVIDRRCTRVVGTFRKMGHFAYVTPDDQRILQDIYVPEEHFGGAQDGEKVAVHIDRFDDRKASPEGHVLHVIGPATDPGVRVLSLAMSMDVKADFPEEVEAEAARIPQEIPSEQIQQRRDLRGEDIFTIDPFDAKDFDDAIHIKKLSGGNYEIGVHIADVSYYVRPGTAMDREALERATSVYLVDRTIPMLPEKLSNKVCSLRPHEDKLAFSCIMEVTPHGTVERYELCASVIHSKQRMTYDKAQDYIDGGFPEDPLAGDVVQAARLARTLTKKRMREGSVDFDRDELKVLLDDKGHPTEIVRKERQASNRLIEELMLLANRTVAQHIGKPHNGQAARPFAYRVHAMPDAEKIQQLAEYVRVFGYDLQLTDSNARSTDLNKLLNAVSGTPEEPVITRAALQAMSKATYQTENIGHYGLGFSHYTHFTSPIRRYPDLVVHRLLKRYAAGSDAADTDNLPPMLEHCSERERSAVEAERESVKLKQVEYAEGHVGEVFEGVVTGVTKFGVFVELSDLLVEGLVHVRDMSDDYYEYDEATFTLTGEHTGTSYRPGDTVTVQIAAANTDKREIDLLFAD